MRAKPPNVFRQEVEPIPLWPLGVCLNELSDGIDAQVSDTIAVSYKFDWIGFQASPSLTV